VDFIISDGKSTEREFESTVKRVKQHVKPPRVKRKILSKIKLGDNLLKFLVVFEILEKMSQMYFSWLVKTQNDSQKKWAS